MVADGPGLQELEMGRVLLQGAGAVGSTFAYLWPLFPFSASIDVVDRDVVKVENMGGVPAFGVEDVGTNKAEVVARELRSSGTGAKAIPDWFDGSVTPLRDYDVVVPAADEKNVRAVTMENNPPLMVGGSIGPNWMAYGHRFIPFRDGCLACRFQRPAVPPRLRCAEGTLDRESEEDGEQHTGALSFLSLAAALLGLAHCAKLALPEAPDASMTELWLYGPPCRLMSSNKTCRAACSVRHTRAQFERFHGEKRFTYLSNM